VQVARRVDDGHLGRLPAAIRRSRPSARAETAVAAYSASAGVIPISRTASAIAKGIDDE